MGRYIFKLPDVGEGTAEAEIVAWHVKPGDTIAEDQNLVDVMTDKATVEMTSPVSGKVIRVHGEPGQMAAVGSPLVELDVEGAGNTAGTASAPLADAALAEETKTDAAIVAASAFVAGKPGDKPLASPVVRRRAADLGIDLQHVPGTGPAGRITHADLDRSIAPGGEVAQAVSSRSVRGDVQDVKLIGLRRKTAEKMQEATRRIPHFAYVEEIDMTEVESLRVHLNATKRAGWPKLSVLPFFMQALVRVLPDYPQINAHFNDDAGIVHRFAPVHIGIATQTSNGLMVPVVKHVETLSVWDMAAEVARVAALAREGKAGKDDLSGSTITITSLGPLGGVATTPIINYPEVAIIGPNAIVERPVARDGRVDLRKMMNLSSSFDHRVVDGYDAAAFIQRIKSLLERPATLFMD